MSIEERPPLLSEIEKKCKEAGILTETNKQSLIIHFPIVNKETKKLRIRNVEREMPFMQALLQTPFEKFLCFGNYRAIWSSELGIIEAKLYNPLTSFPVRYLRHLKNEKVTDSDNRERFLILSDSDRYSSIKISIGRSTKTFEIVDLFRDTIPNIMKREDIRRYARGSDKSVESQMEAYGDSS